MVDDEGTLTCIPDLGCSPAESAVAYHADRLGFLLDTARKFGPVVQLWPEMIMITGPSEVREVLSRTGREFLSDRDLLLKKRRYPGPDELKGRRLPRRAVLDAMTPEILAQHATWLEDRTNVYASQLLREEMSTDIMRVLSQVMSESIVRFCFGSRGNAAIAAATDAVLDSVLPIYSSRFHWPAYIRLMQAREWKSRARLRALHAELRAARAKSGNGGLVEMLSPELSDSTAVNLLASMHLAGTKVPAAAVAWALVELARNPDEQERAASAAMSWDTSSPVPPILEHVVNETLRLWPPSWNVTRTVRESARCGSWILPAGATILLPFWVIHRLADCPHPDVFDSSRWEDNPPAAESYLPFSGGPRWCLGTQFAKAEMVTMLGVLLRRIRFSVRGNVAPDARHVLIPMSYELLFEARLLLQP